jgi:hypothetical protein
MIKSDAQRERTVLLKQLTQSGTPSIAQMQFGPQSMRGRSKRTFPSMANLQTGVFGFNADGWNHYCPAISRTDSIG